MEGEGGVQGEYSEWCSKGLDRIHNAKIRTYIATLLHCYTDTKRIIINRL